MLAVRRPAGTVWEWGDKGSYLTVDEIEPGHGYWIWADAAASRAIEASWSKISGAISSPAGTWSGRWAATLSTAASP